MLKKNRSGLVASLLLVLLFLFLWESPNLFEQGGQKSPSQPERTSPLETTTAPTEDIAAAAATTVADAPAVMDHEANDNVVSEGTRVYGVVYLGDDTPCPQATVVLNGVQAPRQQTVSGADGTFSFTQVPEGIISIIAFKGKYSSFQELAAIRCLTVPEDAQAVGPINLVLTEARHITIKVVSADDGKAISGANVVVAALGMQAQSDAAGEVSFPLTAEIWYLEVSAQGFANTEATLSLAGADLQLFVIEMGLGGVIYGQITDPLKQPLAEVKVSATCASCGEVSVLSDLAGNYRLEGMPLKSPVGLFAKSPRYAYYYSRDNLVPVTKELQIDIILSPDTEPTQDFHGRVSDAQGSPLAGAIIKFGNSPEQVKSDVKGNYQLRDVKFTPFPGYLEASLKGYTSKRMGVQRSGSDTEVNFTLGRGHYLAGYVIDENGQPLSGVYARALLLENSIHSITDDQGRFSFEGLEDLNSVYFDRSGFMSFRLDNPELDRDDLEVVLLPGLWVLGRVVDEKTELPIEHFKVGLKRGLFGGSKKVSFQDKQGAFQFPVSRDELCDLLISADGYPAREFSQVVATVRDGTRYTYALSEDGVHVAGQVQDSEGRPMAGIELVLHNGESTDGMRYYVANIPVLQSFSQISDTLGRFDFGMRSSGVGEIQIDHAGYALQKFPLNNLPREQLEQLKIVILREAGVIGRVNRDVYPDAQKVSITNIGRRSFANNTQVFEGQFEKERLSPGPYSVYLYSAQELLARKDVTLMEGEMAHITFGDDEYFRVSGQITLEGRVVSEGSVTLVAVDSLAVIQSAVPDARGFVQFDRVVSGVYRLSYQRSGFKLKPSLQGSPDFYPIQVEREDVVANWDFRANGRLSGRVVSSETELRLVLLNPGGRAVGDLHCDAEGFFSFAEISPDTYQIFVFRDSTRVRLAEGILMPEDGSSLDLGELELPEESKLLLHFKGSIVSGSSLGFLYVHTAETPDDLLFRDPKLVSETFTIAEEVELEHLPEGPVKLALSCLDGSYRIEPAVSMVHLSAELPVELTVSLTAVTYLKIVNFLEPHFTGITLTHDETGASTVLMPGELKPQQEGALFQLNSAKVRGVAPGLYRVSIQLSDGSMLEREVTLLPGEGKNIDLP